MQISKVMNMRYKDNKIFESEERKFRSGFYRMSLDIIILPSAIETLNYF